AAVLQDEIAAIRAQILATEHSAIVAPDGAGPATSALYEQLNAKEIELRNIRNQINANINSLNQLVENAADQGVGDLPGAVTTIPRPELINASQSVPV